MINDDDESLVEAAAGWRLSINRSRQPATSRRREARARPDGTLTKETYMVQDFKHEFASVGSNKCSTCRSGIPKGKKDHKYILRGIPTPPWNEPFWEGPRSVQVPSSREAEDSHFVVVIFTMFE